MKTFPELLTDAQAALRSRVQDGANVRTQQRKLVEELFETGHKLGLTSKEITQVLLKAVAFDLRPGLRQS